MQPEAGVRNRERCENKGRIRIAGLASRVKVGGARFDFDAAGCPETARRLG